MAKKTTNAVDLAEKQYLCPQCFTQHYRNDVLFASGRFTSRCDTRQAALRCTFQTPDAFAAWCAGGRCQTMVTWTDRPNEDRHLRNGMVDAMRDAGGNWLDQKVCPYCHSLLGAQKYPIFGWRGDGMDNTVPAQLLSAAGGTAVQREDDQSLPYLTLTLQEPAVTVGVPVGLETPQNSYGRACQQRCGTNAAGAVVLLDVQSGIVKLNTDDAIFTLESFLSACAYSGSMLSMPALFVVQGVTAQEFMQGAEMLARRIEVSLKRQRIVGADALRDPAQAAQALAWLAQQMKDREE